MGLFGILRRQWAERGQRRIVPHEMGYKWTYLYGVGGPARGETFAWELPELNPMENVWKVLKGELANRVYGTLNPLSRALGRAWNHLTTEHSTMRSLLHAPYLNLSF